MPPIIRLCWRLALLTLPPSTVSRESALAFLPPNFLSEKQRHLYDRIVTSIRSRTLCSVEHSRHGGAHRAFDKPMGGLLVLPLHERRVQVAAGMREHLDRASRLSFPLDSRLRATALSADLQCATRVSYSLGQSLADKRRALISEDAAEADKLRHISHHVNTLMPPTVRRIAATVNTVYMAACIDANEWLDTTLVQSFIYGFKVVGNIDDSLVYRPIPALTDTIAEARLTQFRHNARAWNERLMTRLRAKSTADSVTAAKDLAVAQKSAKELSKAVIVGPYLSIGAIHEAMVQLHPHLPPNEVYPALLERFGVEQKGDVRAIDNGRSNGANKATNMAETVTTPSFFYVAIVARAYAVAADTNPPPPMTTTLLDLSMAYRTIPSAQPWYTTVAFYNPITKHPELYWLPGHNFGLKSAVVNFNRYPELVCIIARAQYAVVCEHYYDDFIIPDLQLGENTAQHAIEQRVLSLGPGEPRDPRRGHISSPEIDPKKTKEHNTKNTVLGIIADVGNVQHGTVSFDASADRITSVLKTFRDAFVANQLLPHEASSIRGKLFFVLSAAYAMVGRAATLTLVQRQYRDKAPFAFQDGSELHHSLLFFEALLPNLPRLCRTTCTRHNPSAARIHRRLVLALAQATTPRNVQQRVATTNLQRRPRRRRIRPSGPNRSLRRSRTAVAHTTVVMAAGQKDLHRGTRDTCWCRRLLYLSRPLCRSKS